MDSELLSRWTQTLTQRYAQSGLNTKVSDAVERLGGILETFRAKGLANANFESSLTGSNVTQSAQRLGELLLFHYLERANFTLSNSDDGPDFIAEKGGKRFYFELVTPASTEIATSARHLADADPLRPNPGRAANASHEALLRITSQLQAKRDQFARWANQGACLRTRQRSS